MAKLLVALAGARLCGAGLTYHDAETDAARAIQRATCGAATTDADPTKSAIRVATFMASPTRGGSASTNYFHFFFGALVPFVHWASREAGPNDVVILNDVDYRPPHFIPKALTALRPALCVKRLATSRDMGRNGFGLLNATFPRALGDVAFRRPEIGIDHHLYGCGLYPKRTYDALTERLRVTTAVLANACGCNETNKKAFVVTVVRRKAQQGFAHHNRTVPNHGAFTDALRAWADTQGVVQIDEVDFAELDLCGQWCAARRSQVIVGQHGAGLSNAAFLLDPTKVGLVEIAPAQMQYKNMFHCVAGLVGAHYAVVQQPEPHSPIDVPVAVQSVADVVGLARRGAAIPPRSRYPHKRQHHLPVCGPSGAWAIPFDCYDDRK
mmetsp:Transcript_12316/g.37876  ORF Transcript_12316/g.37876 Transcript_12316/m.37876 type:complete len:381 (+) Transcript_12316:1131-2273(+)